MELTCARENQSTVKNIDFVTPQAQFHTSTPFERLSHLHLEAKI